MIYDKRNQESKRDNQKNRFSMIGKIIVFAMLFMAAARGIALAAPELPDVFSHEDIRIEAGQSVGRLLVAGGNAVVQGSVSEGIVVVDGNLTVLENAVVDGELIVLGGEAEISPNAEVTHKVFTYSGNGAPLTGIVITALLLVGFSLLAAIPIFVWLFVRFWRSSPPGVWLRKQLSGYRDKLPVIYIVIALAVSALMLALFADMAWETLLTRESAIFDGVVVWLVRYYANPALDQAMIVVSDLGYGYPFIIFLFVVVGALAFYRRWLELFIFALCMGGGAVLNVLLKHLFARSRPDLFRVVEEMGFSFPSGHAMVSLCLYGMSAFLLSRYLKRWPARFAVFVLAGLLTAAIGVSRIYLGVHYPTDVVAGFMAGTMWLSFCMAFLLWREKKEDKDKEKE